MTEPSATLSSLLSLGFDQRAQQNGMEALGYRFRYLDLMASDTINLSGVRIVYLNGILNTGRTLALIDAEVPQDLDTPEAAAAWVSYALRSHRADLQPLPHWFVDGEKRWSLIPQVRRQRAYEARSRCTMRRDLARILRRDLRNAFDRMQSNAQVEIRFDGRVLTLQFGDDRIDALADGNPWPTTIVWSVSADTKLPPKFDSDLVGLSYFDGHFLFYNHRYPATQKPA